MPNHQPKKEGQVATLLEEVTSRVPSDVYLWTAVGTAAAALGLFIGGKKHTGLLLGQLAPSLLIIGLYNKLVKIEGHDEEDKEEKEQKTPRRNTNSPAPSY
jgi:hypothetical protein